MAATMPREELMQLPPVVDLETAGRALGIGRTKAYELAQHDEFPVKILKVGAGYRVITSDLHRVLGVDEPYSGDTASNS